VTAKMIHKSYLHSLQLLSPVVTKTLMRSMHFDSMIKTWSTTTELGFRRIKGRELHVTLDLEFSTVGP